VRPTPQRLGRIGHGRLVAEEEHAPESTLAPMRTPGASPAPRTDARVLLIGMMGSGKSSVGRALAERTGWPFLDNDALVERETGLSAKQLLEERGEPALRQAEARAFRAALERDPPSVIAVAGGVLTDPRERARIAAAGFVAWLTASAAVLAERASGAEHRPWLTGDARAWFEATARDRERLYAEVADLELDTGVMGPDEAAARILEALASGTRGSVPSPP
jgi:shikimate kinase